MFPVIYLKPGNCGPCTNVSAVQVHAHLLCLNAHVCVDAESLQVRTEGFNSVMNHYSKCSYEASGRKNTLYMYVMSIHLF